MNGYRLSQNRQKSKVFFESTSQRVKEFCVCVGEALARFLELSKSRKSQWLMAKGLPLWGHSETSRLPVRATR